MFDDPHECDICGKRPITGRRDFGIHPSFMVLACHECGELFLEIQRELMDVRRTLHGRIRPNWKPAFVEAVLAETRRRMRQQQ